MGDHMKDFLTSSWNDPIISSQNPNKKRLKKTLKQLELSEYHLNKVQEREYERLERLI